jgi:hypothetical protein
MPCPVRKLHYRGESACSPARRDDGELPVHLRVSATPPADTMASDKGTVFMGLDTRRAQLREPMRRNFPESDVIPPCAATGNSIWRSRC